MTDRALRRRRLRRAAFAAALVGVSAVAIVVSVSRQQAVASQRRGEASRLVALGRLELETDPTLTLAYVRKRGGPRGARLVRGSTPGARGAVARAGGPSPARPEGVGGVHLRGTEPRRPVARLQQLGWHHHALLGRREDDPRPPEQPQRGPSPGGALLRRLSPTRDVRPRRPGDGRLVRGGPGGRAVPAGRTPPPVLGRRAAAPAGAGPGPAGVAVRRSPDRKSRGARIGVCRPGERLARPRESRHRPREGPRGLPASVRLAGLDSRRRQGWRARCPGGRRQRPRRHRVDRLVRRATRGPHLGRERPTGGCARCRAWIPIASSLHHSSTPAGPSSRGSRCASALSLSGTSPGRRTPARCSCARARSPATAGWGAFLPDGRWLATALGSRVAFWPLRVPWPRVIRVGPSPKVAFTPDSRQLVSCGNGETRIYPVTPDAPAAHPVAVARDFTCYGLAMDPSGGHVLLAATTRALLLAPLDGGEALPLVRVPPTESISAVALDAPAAGRRRRPCTRPM